VQTRRRAVSDPPVSTGPDEEEIREALARILASPGFLSSDRRREFLRYIVEEALAGRGDRLKGYSIAVAVYERGEDFDSQADPVVRLEARRLRRDLDSYYVDAGSLDPVRLSIPKGSYVPRFEWNAKAPSPERVDTTVVSSSRDQDVEAAPKPDPSGPGRRRSGRTGRVAAMAIVSLIVVAVVGWLALPDSPPVVGDSKGEPAVVVLPFEALGSSADSRFLAQGISQELTDDLMQVPGFRLYTLPIGSTRGEDATLKEWAESLGATYVIRGSVLTEGEAVHLKTQIYDATSGRVVWSGGYDHPFAPDALIGVQRDLAGEIATVLGQPYGIINEDLRDRASTAAVTHRQSYVCVLRAYVYRRNFSREAFGPVLRCLEDAVRRDPQYSDAWAMLGWLHLDAGRYEFTAGGQKEEEYEAAFEAASRAVQIEPDNVLALKALASINHYMGHFDESARLARRAVALNPYDPDALAQLGWRLAARGKFSEGIALLKRAIQRSANPPGWYFHLIAIDLYLKGDFEEMLEVAQQSTDTGIGVSQMLVAVAANALCDAATTRQALARMPNSGPMARDPADYLRRHGLIEEVVDALMQGLEDARSGRCRVDG